MQKAVGLLIVVLLSASMLRAQKQVWNLSRDIQSTGNQISFDQGTNGVWYFMESSSTTRDPLTYRFLGHYGAPCDENGKNGPFAVRGLACWSSIDTDYSRGENLAPSVTFNFTGKTIYLSGYPNVGIPPRTLVIDPTVAKLGIVAWKSPVAGTILIAGDFTDLHPGGPTGVRWSVDKVKTTLAAGQLPEGGSQSFYIPGLAVTKGQVLYFTIDALGNQDTDEIALTVRIVQTQ